MRGDKTGAGAGIVGAVAVAVGVAVAMGWTWRWTAGRRGGSGGGGGVRWMRMRKWMWMWMRTRRRQRGTRRVDDGDGVEVAASLVGRRLRVRRVALLHKNAAGGRSMAHCAKPDSEERKRDPQRSANPESFSFVAVMHCSLLLCCSAASNNLLCSQLAPCSQSIRRAERGGGYGMRAVVSQEQKGQSELQTSSASASNRPLAWSQEKTGYCFSFGKHPGRFLGITTIATGTCASPCIVHQSSAFQSH